MVFVMTFTNTTSWLSQIVTATMFSPVYETSNGLPENRTRSFLSELESFVKDVSKFGVVSVTKKHCSTSLVNEAELQAQIM
jgi:Na+/H+ antiporter NhaC